MRCEQAVLGVFRGRKGKEVMKYLNKEKKKSNKGIVIALIACVAVLAVVLSIAFWPGWQEQVSADDTTPQNSTAGEETVPDDGTVEGTEGTEGQTETAGSDVIEITTDYCTMYYPNEWEEYLDIREECVEASVVKHFYCLIADEEYRLFTICFGETEVGNLFGYLPADGGKVAVYIDCSFLPTDHTLTEEQVQTFYNMLDGVNSITQSIAACEGYEAPQD